MPRTHIHPEANVFALRQALAAAGRNQREFDEGRAGLPARNTTVAIDSHIPLITDWMELNCIDDPAPVNGSPRKLN